MKRNEGLVSDTFLLYKSDAKRWALDIAVTPSERCWPLVFPDHLVAKDRDHHARARRVSPAVLAGWT